MFPPEPSSTLMLLRSLCTTIGEVAALSLIRLTRPRASAKAWRGVSPLVAAKPLEAMQQRQKARLDRPEGCVLVIHFLHSTRPSVFRWPFRVHPFARFS